MTSSLDAHLDRLDTGVDWFRGLLLDLECDRFDVAQVKRARRLMTKTRAMIDAVDADLARRGRDLRKGDDSRDVDEALNPNRQQSDAKPPRDESRGDVFDKLPGMGDATRNGDLPGEYTDVVNRALKPLSEEEQSEFCRRHQDLHETAARLGIDAFARHVRSLVAQVQTDCGVERLQQQRRQRSARAWTDVETGMEMLFARFDMETGVRVKAAINTEIDRLYRQRRDDPNDTRTREQLMADAVANLICGAQTGSQPGTDLVVLIDLHTLLDDLNDIATDTSDHDDEQDSNTNDVDGQDGNVDDAEGTTSSDDPEPTPVTSMGDHRDNAHTDDGPVPTDNASTTQGSVTGLDDSPPSGTQPTGTRSVGPKGHRRSRPPDSTESPPTSTGPPNQLRHVAGRRVCETSDGTQLPVDVIRRMACDANIIPVVLSSDGVVLDEGRRVRLATREQRLALRAMYDTCALNDCHVPFDKCEIHHLNPFGPPTNGSTDLNQLAPICTRHHHQAHDGHWTMRLDPTDRTLTITYPNGHTETHPLTPPEASHADDMAA